jgi:YbbR domain-containing protein
LLESKWGLRLIALLLALFMFLSVNNVFEEFNFLNGDSETDENEVVQDVPVEVLSDEGNYVSGAPKQVNVRLSGNTSNLVRMETTRDFEVSLDLREYEIGEHEVRFAVENLPENVTAEVVPETATVNIQEMVERTFEVQAEVSDSRVGPNHQLEDVTIEPETVTVMGGENEVNRIQYVRATLNDNSRITEDRVEEAEIGIFDFQFNRLDVTSDPANVRVEIDVSELSKEVPINEETTGSVDSEHEVENVQLNNDTIEIFGPQEILNQIDSIDAEVDVEDMDRSETKEVDLNIPEGVTKTNPESIEAEITIGDK